MIDFCKMRCEAVHDYTKDTPKKEKRMNLYTITAREINTVTYEVESTCEEEAINDVECGNVEPYDKDFDELVDVEVTDVQYREQMYVADLTLSFNAKGISEENVRDLLWDLLVSFDGQTVEDGDDCTLEAIGFNIVDMKEA